MPLSGLLALGRTLQPEKSNDMKISGLAGVAAAALMAAAVGTAPAGAQARAAQAASAVPNFGGLWVPVGSAVDVPEGVTYTGADDVPAAAGPPFGSVPELKGKYLESYQKRKKKNESLGIEFKTSCKILGMPTVMVGPYAVEILQTPAQINWTQEFLHETRRIYLDGRTSPSAEELPATFEGYSTGKWDGDTLVVETVNIRQETTLGEYSHSEDALGHSEKLRFVERMRIDKDGLLKVEATAEDPDALVRPWHYTLTFRRAPAEDQFMEFVCEDNNADTIDPATGAEITNIPKRTLPDASRP